MGVKKFTSIILVFLLAFSTYGPVMAKKLTDIDGHWAEQWIQSAIDKELVEGYPDGTFRPNDSITRAEFVTLANSKFDFVEKSEVEFPDVETKAWYADEIAVAAAAGYITGFEDGSMRPKEPISRQEVAVILTSILDLKENEEAAETFEDTIPKWSKGSVGAVASNELMVGFPSGNFEPKKAITRAESIVTLENVLTETVTYDKAGTYGPENGAETIEGNVEVTAEGVTLQNLIIEGNLVIAKSVGEGDVTLNNVTVEGTTTINGGGENSIHVNDSVLNKVVVNKANNKIRIVTTGSSSIDEVTLKSGAKLEESNVTGKGFNNVVVDALEDSKIILEGEFVSVTIMSSNTTIKLPSRASIQVLTVNKNAIITGNGAIDEANVNAEGVNLQITPNKVNVKDGVDSPTITTPGSGGETYNPPTVEQPGDEEGEEPSTITITNIENLEETVSLGDDVQLPATVKVTMSDGSETDQPIVWSGVAYTDDVGTFEYEGAVEGYDSAVTYTLSVELTGYEENTEGTIAYVNNVAAAEYAEEIITIEEVVIQSDLTLPENYSLPIKVDTDNVTLDLNANTVGKVTVNADNVTLKNGTINKTIYGEGIKTITLEDITDASTSEHIINQANIDTLKFLGSTNLTGDIYLQGGAVELTGDPESALSGIVRVETSQPVTVSLSVSTVIVDMENATVDVSDNVTIENMIVRKSAIVNLGSGATITTPEKRTGVTVTVNEDVDFGVAGMRVQSTSTVTFEEVLDTIDLERYIHAAGNFVVAAEPGELDGQFPQTAIDALSNAKGVAETKLQGVMNSSDDLATKQSEIDAAVETLHQALTDFGEKRIFLDTSTLRNKLRAMEQLLSRTSIGDTHGHVPQEAYDAFETAVGEVKTAFKNGLTAAQIEEQTQKLDAAHDAFEAAYIELPFFDPDSYTIEGKISFVLTDPEEVFTDFSNFKVLEKDEQSERYSRTGWSIHSGNREAGWRTMEVDQLNHHNVNLEEAEKVYYTVATNRRIYTGTFTVEEFLNESEVELVPQDEATGTVNLNAPSAGENFMITHIVASRTDENFEQQWVDTNEIAQTTNLPVGTYTIEVYGYDDNHEYILKKELEVVEGENSIEFSKSDMDTITLNYENFTGWDLQPYQYRADDSRLSSSYYYRENERIVNPSLKITSNYGGIEVGYYANHSERPEEQWRYNVYIPRGQESGDEEITSSSSFEFKVESFLPENNVVDPTAPFYQYFNVNIVNDIGHVLRDLYFYHGHSFLEYSGEVSIKDKSGRIQTKQMQNLWDYQQMSIEDIFPRATGELEVIFSIKDTPFLIPDKTVNVTVD
jgi:hypothetical protein